MDVSQENDAECKQFRRARFSKLTQNGEKKSSAECANEQTRLNTVPVVCKIHEKEIDFFRLRKLTL